MTGNEDNNVENHDNRTNEDVLEENLTSGVIVKQDKKISSGMVNKRIDFDQKTLKRIEMMIPVFRDGAGEGASANDVMSYIIGKGIDALFGGEFKQKLDEM